MKKRNVLLIASMLLSLVFGQTPYQLTTADQASRSDNIENIETMYGETLNRTGTVSLSQSRSGGKTLPQVLLTEEVLELQLFDDRTIQAKRSSISRTPNGGIFWRGEVIRGEDGSLSLYYLNGVVSGSLNSSDVIYKVTAVSETQLRIIEIDPSRIPAEDKVCNHDDEEEEHNHSECNHAHHDDAEEPCVIPPTLAAPLSRTPQIDVLIVYPQSVADGMERDNGFPTIDAEVNFYVEQVNVIFRNSNIDAHFNLVHHQVEPSVSNSAQSLSNISSNRSIRALRDEYGADIVSYWANGNGKSGSGYNLDGGGDPENGYNTSKFSLVTSYYTFAHECGHNMGAKHDRQAYSSSTKQYKLLSEPAYRFGKSFSNYRSIMSYDNCPQRPCNREEFYTNPDIMVNGAPFGVTGTGATSSLTGPANNSRRINETASIVERWRTSKAAAKYTLTLSSGAGGGSFFEGTIVDIIADDAPAGKVFDHWEGDTRYLGDPNSAATSVTIPSKNISLTAVYRDIAAEVFMLTVTSGTGDGDYEEGTEVSISADAAAEGTVFDSWTGDVSALASITSATTTVTMPANAVTVTATYKTVVALDTSNLSVNLVSFAGWDYGHDDYGSAGSIDSSLIPDSVVSGTLTAVADYIDAVDANNSKYAWVKASAYLDSMLTNVTVIALTYKSNKPLKFVFEQALLSDAGTAYYLNIPATSKDSTVYLSVPDFAQDTWSGSLVGELLLDIVSAVSLEAVEKGATTIFSVSNLRFNNYPYDTNPVSIASETTNTLRPVGVTSFSKGGFSLNIARAGTYSVSVVSLSGRVLMDQQSQLTAGVNAMSLSSIRSGVYIVRVSGEGVQEQFKAVMQ